MGGCNHDLVECETAVSCDGICPICQAATISRLREELTATNETHRAYEERFEHDKARIAAMEGAVKKRYNDGIDAAIRLAKDFPLTDEMETLICGLENSKVDQAFAEGAGMSDNWDWPYVEAFKDDHVRARAMEQRLTATIKQLRARREAQDRLHIENTNDLVACRERIATLEGALKKYGTHTNDCAGNYRPVPCTCGFDQALAEGGG